MLQCVGNVGTMTVLSTSHVMTLCISEFSGVVLPQSTKLN